MKNKVRLLSLILVFSIGPAANGQTTTQIRPAAVVKAQKYLRTELYFGRSRPGGALVSDSEWSDFLASVVTPRFPDGFTVIHAVGQYRDKNGKVAAEPSAVLIILYSRKDRTKSRTKIEEIRAAYVKRFDQESVLRMDLKNSVDVRF
jgi:uncharacterized protein DUF3574